MPELPDVTVYIEALQRHLTGARLLRVRLTSPFLLRTVEPPLSSLENRNVVGAARLGKRIALEFEGEHYAVIHLMIAGRLHWKEPAAKPPGKRGLACFDFAAGTLLLTEAGPKKRASLHLAEGRAALAEHDPGGIEPLDCTLEAFQRAVTAENHTLKRTLTDPRVLAGIGNAYSDEILHHARLSPIALSQKLEGAEIERLYAATRTVLGEWTARLRAQAGVGFPEHVTAFRKEMAVHGRYGRACPVCGSEVQRIVYASNESNYCARCQTGGRLLADRALSRLLKSDWPLTLEELEERRAARHVN